MHHTIYPIILHAAPSLALALSLHSQCTRRWISVNSARGPINIRVHLV
eukprot:COSAG01_NODE_42435_length_440_cov_0.747801_1_plen_47_part_10